MFENNRIMQFIIEVEKKIPFFRYLMSVLAFFILISGINSLNFPNSDIPIIWIIAFLFIAILIIVLSATLPSKDQKKGFLTYLSYTFISVVALIASVGLIFVFTSTFFDWPKPTDEIFKTNIKKHADNDLKITNLGNFYDDTLMANINGYIENHQSGNFYIVADFACYGIFSHPDRFEKYIQIIKESSTQKKNKLTMNCLFLNETMQKKVLEAQFRGFDTKLEENKKKVSMLLNNQYARKVLPKKRYLTSLFNNSYSKENLIDLLLSIEKEIINDLMNNCHISVKQYPLDLPIHLWSFDGKGGIITIVNFVNPSNETAFKINGDTDFFTHVFEKLEKEAN